MKKHFISITLGCFFNICVAQFHVTPSSELHIINEHSLYFDIDLVNQGSINYDSDGELVLDQGLDNSTGSLALNDALLKLGSGTVRANGTHTLTFNNSDDTVKFVELDKNSGTLNVSSNVPSTGFLRIKGTFTSNSGTLNANDRIVLVSGTESSHPDYEPSNPYPNTAIVPESMGGSVNSIRVERYFTGNRAWRFLSSPVATDDPIFNNWQQSGLNPGDGGYLPNIGTHVTGGASSNGFDQNASGNPSLYIRDNSNQSWITLPNTNNTTLEIGQNYYTLVRGDRSVDLSINDFTTEPPTVLRSTGSLHIGNFDVPHTLASGDFFVAANPYQSPVDMSEVRTTSSNSFTNEMWVWVQQSNTTGQYAHITLSTGSNSLPGLSNANKFLQPSQAVFVQADTNNPSINYRESHKVDNSNLTDIFSSESMNNFLRIGLYGTEETPFVDVAYDGLIMLMNNTHNTATTIEDGEKFFNNEENIAIQYNNAYLTVDKRAAPEDLSEVIDLYINNIDKENYNFSIELTGYENLPNGLLLWDKYHDTYTPLSNGLIIPISFDLSIPESTDQNRFAITFESQNLNSDNFNADKDIQVYPNAFEDEIKIIFSNKFIGAEATLTIYDIIGKKIFSKKISKVESINILNNLNFSSGNYLLNLTGKGFNQSFKLIKK